MIISDLEILEVVETANVQGGIIDRSYTQTDSIGITFDSVNSFATSVTSPTAVGNSAAAGAKGDAQRNFPFGLAPTFSFTKADTVAVTEYLGASFSGSTSVAVINGI